MSIFYTEEEMMELFGYNCSQEENYKWQRKLLGITDEDGFIDPVCSDILVVMGHKTDFFKEKEGSIFLPSSAASESGQHDAMQCSEAQVVSLSADCYMRKSDWPKGPPIRHGDFIVAHAYEYKKIGTKNDYIIATIRERHPILRVPYKGYFKYSKPGFIPEN